MEVLTDATLSETFGKFIIILAADIFPQINSYPH